MRIPLCDTRGVDTTAPGVDSAPNAPYLIQTDPAFADRQTWLSSDYYFQHMGLQLAKLLRLIAG